MDYSKFLNPQAAELKPSGIRKFFNIVSERKGAISLGVGEPDFDTPHSGRDAAVRSIKQGKTQYTANSGMPKLRQMICRYYQERYDLTYAPDTQCLVTVGASEGIDLALRSLLVKGDEVLIPDPSYVSYAPCVLLSGGIPVGVPCRAENDFAVLPSDLESAINERTKVLIFPYPNNPTGGIVEKDALEKIAKVCIEKNLFVISDEIYSELNYSSHRHVSIASVEGMQERCAVINGFSKSFAMTGWRLGYILAPTPLSQVMLKVHQFTVMCAPTPSQFAAIALLEEGFADDFAAVADMRSRYDIRRRYLVNELNRIGLDCFVPKGAFYVFPCVKSTSMDGEEFASKLLDSKNVAVVPGSAFGDSGKDYVRISYAYSMKNLEKAMRLIEDFVTEIKG